MSEVGGSHGDAAHVPLRDLDFTGYAQEFLRRNQTYRAQYVSLSALEEPSGFVAREMALPWGLMFPDRSRSACVGRSSHLACRAPAILILEPAKGLSEALTLKQIVGEREILLDRIHDRGRHLYLATSAGLQRMWLRAPSRTGFDCVVLTAPDLDTRIEALRSFQASLSPSGTAPPASRLVPTRFQRFRLDLMLRTLDHLTDANPAAPIRSVARHITFPHSRFASASEWKGSSERRQTQRWIDQARSLAAGGFGALLKGRIPSQSC